MSSSDNQPSNRHFRPLLTNRLKYLGGERGKPAPDVSSEQACVLNARPLRPREQTLTGAKCAARASQANGKCNSPSQQCPIKAPSACEDRQDKLTDHKCRGSTQNAMAKDTSPREKSPRETQDESPVYLPLMPRAALIDSHIDRVASTNHVKGDASASAPT